MVRVKRSDESQNITAQGGNISFSVFEEVRGSANIGINGSVNCIYRRLCK